MVTLVRYMDKDLLKQLPQCEGGEEDLCDIDPSKLLLEHVSRYCYHHDQLNDSMLIHLHSSLIHHSFGHPHPHHLQTFPWQLLLHWDECRWTKSDVRPNRAGCPISTR